MTVSKDQDHAQLNGHSNNGHSTSGHNVLERLSHDPQQVDYPKLLQLGRELLVALGEDPDREGLRDTPRRWADAWREFIEYDPGTLDTVFASASVDQMVTVSGIKVSSLCVPSRQHVNTVDGSKRACDVKVGEKLWTLHHGEVKQTEVTHITSHKTHDVVEVITNKGRFKVTSDHPLATPQGWMEAKDVSGQRIEWTETRTLFR